MKPGAAAYSDLKAAWHLHGIDSLRLEERFAPPHVQLILSDLCNQDCHFCAYRMSGGFSSENFADENGNRNPKRMIPYEKAAEIIEDLAHLGVQAVQFTGGGEPTVHPQHMSLFSMALSKGLKCGLVTNGTRLQPGWEAVYSRFEWIRVSLDAGNPASYAKIRASRPSVFELVLNNVSALAHECPNAILGVGFVVTPENYGEIVEATRLAKEHGARYVRMSAMFSDQFSTPFRPIYEEIKAQIAEAREKYAQNGFEVVDLFGERISDLDQHAPDYQICGYQHFNCYIGGDQKVYRCCTTAYTRHGEVGDLRNQRFRDWFRESHDKYFNFDARSCNVCQFNNKNRVINYLVGPKPLHVEFV